MSRGPSTRRRRVSAIVAILAVPAVLVAILIGLVRSGYLRTAVDVGLGAVAALMMVRAAALVVIASRSGAGKRRRS